MIFTTSWDDGHPLDLRVAALLERHGCTGTFYLCRAGYGGSALSPSDIHSLAARHEVGAHTLTHPSLPDVADQRAREEIAGSKAWLEDLLQKPCTMFAYPYGRFDQRTRNLVAASGFHGARTAEDLQWEDSDPFLLSTTVQVHTFPFRPVLDRRFLQPLLRHRPRLKSLGVPLLACRSWEAMARAVFRRALVLRKPWFHLWGHSWSIDRFGLWEPFKEFLKFVRSQPNVTHVKNRDLLP